MSKTYKIKVNQGADSAKFVDIPQVGTSGKALTVKAVPGGKYQLMDASTGFAPENIRATRLGKDLQIFFEGRGQADLVIEDYYEVTPEGFNGLIGEAESGRFYEYIPESAVGNTAVPLLADGSTQVGMALGGAEINASGAAVGALVAAAGFNPLLLAPLALLGAAAGGGGSSGAAAATGGGGGGGGATDNKVAKVVITKMDQDTGVKNDDWITKDQTPEFSGTLDGFKTGLGDQVKLTMTVGSRVISEGLAVISADGKTWTWKATDAVAGNTLPATLEHGAYKLTATIVNSKGEPLTETEGRYVQDLTIDIVGESASGTVQIEKMTVDSGINDASRKDFKTNDNTPIFEGKVTESESTQWLEVRLHNTGDNVAAKDFLNFIEIPKGETVWKWEPTKDGLPDANYLLTARLVDQAGNLLSGVNTLKEQTVVIDTKGSTDENDNQAVRTTSISITEDTGESKEDFVTSAGGKYREGLTFKGQLNPEFTQNGGTVLVQIVDSAGKVKSSAYVDSDKESWTYNNSVELMDGQYLAKTILIDHVGNMISATDQAFYIDTVKPNFDEKGDKVTDDTQKTVTYKSGYSFGMTEYGSYKFGDGEYVKYTGGGFDLGSQKTYDAGAFRLEFKDQAGNSTVVTNSSYKWIFNDAPKFINLGVNDIGYLGPKKFDGSQTIGSIGSMGERNIVSDKFDMASLYDSIPEINKQVVANHVVLSDASKNVELTLSLGDVLALGVTNSFSINSSQTLPHKGKIQMLIDGQDGDSIKLDGWVGVENFVWTKPGEAGTSNAALTIGNGNYNVYTHTDLGIALFVNIKITDITVL